MRRTLLVLAILVSTMSAVGQQTAPAPPQLTWLRFYNVDPAHTRDFMDVFNRMNVTVLDRLIADRQIASWGLAVPFTMASQDWTHMLFITVNNWAAGDALIRAFDNMEHNMPAADLQRDQTTLAGALRGVRDVVLRHVQQSMSPPSPNFKPQYIRATFFTVKPGRADDVAAIFREYTVPIYTDLASRGVLGPWGMSTQDVATDPSFTHVVWYFTDSLQRLDQVREAVMARPADARKTFALKVQDASNPEKVHSEILRVVRMNQMTPPAAK